MAYPTASDDQLIGRAEFASLAGVSRSTVTDWEGRDKNGFPSSRRSNGQDYFLRSEVLNWLDQRLVPAARRADGEPAGTTYGQRARKRAGGAGFRAGATGHPPASPYRRPTGGDDEHSPEDRQVVAELTGRLVDRVRGAAGVLDYLNLLFCLHYLHDVSRNRFSALVTRARALRNLDEAAQLLRDIGRAADEDLRCRGVHSSMQEALGHLEPRTIRDLRNVVEAVDRLRGSVFGLILDEYERRVGFGSGEFFTPRPVVRLMTQLACSVFGSEGPESVYDPYARDGGFLVEASAFRALDEDGLPRGKAPRTYGEARRADTWRLATMNLLLHGVSPSLALKTTVPWRSAEQTPPNVYDMVLTNPPFNMSDPGREERHEGEWAYGAPPVDNDNFAWVQHCLARLDKGGRAAIIMPNKAGNSSHKADRVIRRNLAERGCVEGVIALPAKLFTNTDVPVSAWYLRHPDNPCDSTVFLDARNMGEKEGPRWHLRPEDIEDIIGTYHSLRAGGLERRRRGGRDDGRHVPGALVSREELCGSDYSLNPLDHVERRTGKAADPASALPSAWERLRAAEEHVQAVREAIAGASLPGTAEGQPARSRRSAPPADLGSLCDIQAGPSYSRLGKEHRGAGEGVPVVFPRHLKDRRIRDGADEWVTDETARRLKNFELWNADIVCVRSGAITAPALVRESQHGWLMSPNVIRLRVTERHAGRVLPEYLFHYLCLDETVAWMRDRAAATAAPSLRCESLGSLRIPLPDLSEQREVVAALNLVDELDRAHQSAAASARLTRTELADALLGTHVRPHR
ncbi:N-6 DNA methylase [Streptomyces sp. NPDC002248]